MPSTLGRLVTLIRQDAAVSDRVGPWRTRRDHELSQAAAAVSVDWCPRRSQPLLRYPDIGGRDEYRGSVLQNPLRAIPLGSAGQWLV